jgi:glycerol-3-phosphate dehydrogenase
MLIISAEINAHHFAVLKIFNKAPHSIRKTIVINTTGPGAPPLRENQDRLVTFQNRIAFVKGFFHFITIAATVYGDAL